MMNRYTNSSLLAFVFILLPPMLVAQGHGDHQHPEASPEPGADAKAIPAEARDPHAYSGGFSQHSNPYADPSMPPHMHGDDDLYWAVIVDRFEVAARDEASPNTQFEAEAWLGKAFDKILLRTEGEIEERQVHGSENELLWSHAISPYWDAVAGVRYDLGKYAGRGYAAIGIRGLAPYWFESEATLYVSDQGYFGLNAEMEYELLFTQKLILAPRAEISAQSETDEERGAGSGFNSASLGLRLRYEISRQFAPYLGIERRESFGESARIARDEGRRAGNTDYIFGVRLWF